MNLKALSYELRQNVLRIIMAGKGGHIGGDMSVIDILISLYFDQMNIDPKHPDDPDRDRLILSKGHSVEALYAVLAEKGFIDLQTVLDTFSHYQSKFIGHPHNQVPGIEMNTGSLGHGLSLSVGMALAGQKDGRPYRVYTVLGDGELAEGSVWEGVMAAAQYGLDNLCAVIDRNRLQISGSTEAVMGQDDVAERWRSFGWHVLTVDGHDFEALKAAFETAKTHKGQPTAIVAETVKGYGSPVMANKAEWHHRVPTADEYEQIMRDLEQGKAAAQ